MRDYERVAIVGSTGQLGHDLLEAFAGLAVTGLSHEVVSIEDPASVAHALDACKPDLVLNTAAFHNVPLCETEQRRALAVNAVGVYNLAAECTRRGIVFGTMSTDYVFDGTKGAPYSETDEPHPLSVYGVSKLAGELLAAAAAPQHFVFRTSGLFGKLGSKTKGYTFIDRILQQARSGEQINVVSDMTFSPSYTRHVARWMRLLAQRAPFGTYHVTNQGYCTWHEFAVEAVAAAGLKAEVNAISSADYASPVRRPANSSLDHDALRAAGLDDLPHWKAAVAEYLHERTLSESSVT